MAAILGISTFYHNSAAALVVDDLLLGMVAGTGYAKNLKQPCSAASEAGTWREERRAESHSP